MYKTLNLSCSLHLEKLTNQGRLHIWNVEIIKMAAILQ